MHRRWLIQTRGGGEIDTAGKKEALYDLRTKTQVRIPGETLRNARTRHEVEQARREAPGRARHDALHDGVRACSPSSRLQPTHHSGRPSLHPLTPFALPLEACPSARETAHAPLPPSYSECSASGVPDRYRLSQNVARAPATRVHAPVCAVLPAAAPPPPVPRQQLYLHPAPVRCKTSRAGVCDSIDGAPPTGPQKHPRPASSLDSLMAKRDTASSHSTLRSAGVPARALGRFASPRSRSAPLAHSTFVRLAADTTRRPPLHPLLLSINSQDARDLRGHGRRRTRDAGSCGDDEQRASRFERRARKENVDADVDAPLRATPWTVTTASLPTAAAGRRCTPPTDAASRAPSCTNPKTPKNDARKPAQKKVGSPMESHRTTQMTSKKGKPPNHQQEDIMKTRTLPLTQIPLIPHKYAAGMGIGVYADVGEPDADVVKVAAGCDIVDEEAA
ncbi:hypothetical protein C8R45DRAFT_1211907 [Mycena sanguinolenta]|nr:hypothetical protein C8R45DRAFT_1211907 [Mycena sanguinolenta]